MKLPAELQRVVDEQNHFIRMDIKNQFNRSPLSGELIDLTILQHQVKLRGTIELALELENLTQDGELPRRVWVAKQRLLETALSQLEKLTACPKQKSTSLKDSSEPQKKPRRSTPPEAKTSSVALSKTDAPPSPSSTRAKRATAPSSKSPAGRGRKSSAK